MSAIYLKSLHSLSADRFERTRTKASSKRKSKKRKFKVQISKDTPSKLKKQIENRIKCRKFENVPTEKRYQKFFHPKIDKLLRKTSEKGFLKKKFKIEIHNKIKNLMNNCQKLNKQFKYKSVEYQNEKDIL